MFAMATFVPTLRRILVLCRKEFLAIFKDRSARVLLLVPAVVQTFLFGYASTYDLSNVPYALLDQSHGGAAAELVARLDGTGVFHRVATLRSQSEVAQVIDSQQVLMVVQIGPRFEALLQAGETAPVQIIVDARNANTANSAVSYFNAIAASFNAQWQASHGGSPQPLVVQARAWFNPNLDSRWHFLPGLIASLSMLQTLMLTALSVAREREQGTFDQLLVTPLSPMEIMVGKAVPPILIGLCQSTLVLCVALFWFKVPLAGSVFTLYMGLLFFMVASVGLGLAISAVSATMQQAMLYTFVLIMPMMLLSGLTTPVQNMPTALQIATLANPLRFAVDLVQRIYLEGVGLGDVAHDLVPLAVIALVTLPVSAWLFRHRLA